MKVIQVGLIGFGTVGQGLAEVLLTQQKRLPKRTGMSIVLAGIADKSGKALPERFQNIPLVTDGRELIKDPNIDIIVERLAALSRLKRWCSKPLPLENMW